MNTSQSGRNLQVNFWLLCQLICARTFKGFDWINYYYINCIYFSSRYTTTHNYTRNNFVKFTEILSCNQNNFTWCITNDLRIFSVLSEQRKRRRWKTQVGCDARRSTSSVCCRTGPTSWARRDTSTTSTKKRSTLQVMAYLAQYFTHYDSALHLRKNLPMWKGENVG